MSQKPRAEPDKAASEPAAPVEVTGTLGRFTFRNPDNGFAVARLTEEGSEVAWTLVGTLAQLAEGQKVTVRGKVREHARFGPQIEVESAQTIQPTSIEGIRTYLGSGLVKGIGPATAERIVAHFGAETLEVIEHSPDRLAEVQGLGKKKIGELVAAVGAQKEVQAVLVFLRAHGLGQGLASRIVKRYGAQAAGLIEADPYRLVDDVIGVGFKTADQLAREIGLAAESDQRVAAGLLHCLARAAQQGDCFLPIDELIDKAANILALEPAIVAPHIEALTASRRIKVEAEPGPGPDRDRTRVAYPLALHAAESGVAVACIRLLQLGQRLLPLDPVGALERFIQASDMELSDGQRNALLSALGEPVSVITGGPGVGKTTILRALAWIFAQNDLKLLLAAPTGRAAKRLEESTGQSASTVHRLLEYQSGLHRFARDTKNLLEGTMLVIDEASMLDVQLAYHLLRAVPRQ